MGERTGIAWAHHTFSPWWGCQKISPGCLHCYAEDLADNQGRACWGPTTPRSIARDEGWKSPLRWNAAAERAGERRRVFPSMCDVFEGADVPIRERTGNVTTLGKVWPRFAELIDRTPALDWLLLTKRPALILDHLPAALVGRRNVWLGTSIESPVYATRAIDLIQVPAAVHFLSLEPLLEDLRAHVPGILSLEARCWRCGGCGRVPGAQSAEPCPTCPAGLGMVRGIDWIIAGGESCLRGDRPLVDLQRIEERSLVHQVGGKWIPKASALKWIRSIRDACLAVEPGVAFWMKQWGGPRYYSGGAELDGRTWTEVPAVA